MTIASTTNRYDKYKDSCIEWIGQIPQHWEISKIKFSAIVNPKYNENLSSDTLVSFAPMECLTNCSLECKEAILGNVLGGYTYFANNDIIMAKVTPCFENGNIALATNLNNGVGFGSSELYVFRSVNIFNKFLLYLLQNTQFKDKAIATMYGTGGLKRVSIEFVKNYKFACPDLKEQEQIAGYLDRKCGAIDETIEKQKSVIEKLKEYKQSIITQAVTKGLDKSAPMKDSGIEWIGQIPQHWEICKLLKLFKDRKFPNKGNIENNVLSLSYGNIKRRNVETNMGLLPESFESYNIIEPNNIVLRLTDLQNDHKSLRCGLVKERGIITSAYVTLELKDTSQCANYFYRLLHTFDIEKGFYGMGAGVRQSLKYDGELCNLYIIKPPVIEQKQIAEFLDKKCSEIDKTIEDKEKLIEKLVEYKKSLIYECVTGKRKVI